MENKYSKEIIENALKGCNSCLNLEPFNLNIVGIRNNSLIKEKSKFKDRICIIINVYDSIKYFEFSGTTKVYLDGIVSSSIVDNYMIETGQYKNIWKLTEDRILKQRYPIILISGKNKGNYIDYETYSVSDFKTMHGIDLKPLKYLTNARKMSELACQYLEKESNMHILTSYAIMQEKGTGRKIFDYILIDDIDGTLVPSDKVFGEQNG